MIQYFKGNERKVLEDIKKTIESNPEILGSPKRFVDDLNHQKIEQLIESLINQNTKSQNNINESF